MNVHQGLKVLISLATFVVMCFVGGAIMMFVEYEAEGSPESISVQLNATDENFLSRFSWKSYQQWRYFTAVTISTIGYGDLTPKTAIGKFIAMFFALVGIPVYIYMVLSSGAFLSRIIANVKLRCQWRTRFNAVSIIISVLLCILYVIVLGVAVAAYEGWHYFSGIYWAFVGVSTIGYGDLIPTTLVQPCGELVVWFSTFGQILIAMTCGLILRAWQRKAKRSKQEIGHGEQQMLSDKVRL